MPEIFTSRNFLIEVTVNLVLAFLVIIGIYKVGKMLDTHVTWRQNLRRRITLQVFYGVIIFAVLDLTAVSLYLKLLGTNVFKNQFLQYNSVMVISYLLIVNLVFMVGDLLKPKTELESEVDEEFILTINYKRVDMRFNVAKDLLYFYRSGRKVIVVTSKGREYPVDLSITALKETYEKAGFLQISRTLLLNSRIVKSYSSTSDIKRGTLIVVFKSQYLEYIEDPESERFEITAAYLEDFKVKLEQI